MSGYEFDTSALRRLAGGLRTAGTSLERGAAAPPAPEAGACTAAVAAVQAQLAESVAGISEAMAATADGVNKNADLYAVTEDDQTASINNMLTRTWR
jgi:hypothetical protein